MCKVMILRSFDIIENSQFISQGRIRLNNVSVRNYIFQGYFLAFKEGYMVDVILTLKSIAT